MAHRRTILLTASPSPHALPGLGGDLAEPPQTGAGALRTTTDAAVREALATAAETGLVVFADGDPLFRAEILGWIEAARSAGARAVAVETTGHVLMKAGAAERLREAGLSHVFVALFGADAASHDWIVGREGAFARSLRGLKRARAAGLRTHVLAPVLRPTFRALPELVRRSLAIGVHGFEFRAPLGADRPAHGLHPHLALAGPFVQRAIQIARAARRGGATWGLPACTLGDVADAMIEARGGQRVLDAATPTREDRGRTHGEPCKTCAWTAHCPGPLESYEAGFVGFEPRTTLEKTAGPED